MKSRCRQLHKLVWFFRATRHRQTSGEEAGGHGSLPDSDGGWLKRTRPTRLGQPKPCLQRGGRRAQPEASLITAGHQTLESRTSFSTFGSGWPGLFSPTKNLSSRNQRLPPTSEETRRNSSQNSKEGVQNRSRNDRHMPRRAGLRGITIYSRCDGRKVGFVTVPPPLCALDRGVHVGSNVILKEITRVDVASQGLP